MKILVVDDREENRTILQTKLRAHGYETDIATNGAEALAKLRRAKFDAVISDLLMPVMDGYQLTHAIRSGDDTREMPVVIYTSTYTDPRDEALARNLGANAFLLKPTADEKFFSVLADTLARASRGELPSRAVSQDELQRMKDYTARLIHKLEDKLEEVSSLNATLEQRVTAATAGLREANAELEAYVNSVTHDLRAPLRAIEGYSMLLMEDAGMAAAERHRITERIATSAAKMQRLMQDLLDYSRLKHGDVVLEPLDLAAVLGEATTRVSQAIDRTRAEVNLPANPPRVLGVAPILVQAVANLLGNALKFVAPGVVPRVDIMAGRAGDKVRLTVRDNGVGIPVEHQSRVFQVFERLHDPDLYPGTGVGLASVKRAVAKMGGDLGFESAPGKGSAFWLELPAAD